MMAAANSVVLGTRMDINVGDAEPACRVAFYGNIVHLFKDASDHKALRLYRVRTSAARHKPYIQSACLQRD